MLFSDELGKPLIWSGVTFIGCISFLEFFCSPVKIKEMGWNETEEMEEMGWNETGVQ